MRKANGEALREALGHLCCGTPLSIKHSTLTVPLSAIDIPHPHRVQLLPLAKALLKERVEALRSQEESQKTAETEGREPAPKKKQKVCDVISPW